MVLLKNNENFAFFVSENSLHWVFSAKNSLPPDAPVEFTS